MSMMLSVAGAALAFMSGNALAHQNGAFIPLGLIAFVAALEGGRR